MVTADGQIEFTLQPPSLRAPISVRMRRFGARWVAQAGTGSPNVGIAPTPREALTAALAPLGEREATLLLADLSLLEPSCEILAWERRSTG